MAQERSEPNHSPGEANTMSKNMDSHKEGKKKPQKTAHEKRMAKRGKKSVATLLGSHGTT